MTKRDCEEFFRLVVDSIDRGLGVQATREIAASARKLLKEEREEHERRRAQAQEWSVSP